ncbi:hypothetical protein JMG10_01160 [Nostoc ellipsosporum NOK]|nr:hypothetical protein [Nostoc ellipsosporum NOK]
MKTRNILFNGLVLGSLVAGMASCVKKYDNPASGTMGSATYIYAVREAYRGNEITLGTSTLGGATQIQGVVISDQTAGNAEPGLFFIQQTVASANQVGDITRGIALRMSSGNATWNIGDSLRIDVDGMKLDRINGRLTISGVTADRVTKLAENRVPLVRSANLAMLDVMMPQYESSLVAVHADVKDYGTGVNFGGERTLSDNTGPQFGLLTRNEAAFANAQVPVNAQFTGIPGYFNASGKDTIGAKRILQLRNINDTAFLSGVIYSNFPESFEYPDASAKSSYNVTATANNIDLASGNWKLQQAILGNTVIRDKYNLPGKQCVRMQQNLTTSGYVQMNFDVTEGASKVTVFYGKYYTDPSSTFRLEYSVNGGTTWVNVSPNVNFMPDRGSLQATFRVNVTGNVRFRINKLGLGSSSATVFNGRLCLEDIVVYKKL